ncbi:hypothetical protein Q5P01_000329 [Channa striata]|uniref:Uncharacterized protein n=1 Tax=Channa striata TaxID=64152 RepID=A0AA88LJ59_CHASR|nr:hypothetical protein Q5P01_000329 [Channa striata]
MSARPKPEVRTKANVSRAHRKKMVNLDADPRNARSTPDPLKSAREGDDGERRHGSHKASAVEKLKKGLMPWKKVATSARPKGLRALIERAVMSNKDTITKLAKSAGAFDNKIATADQILKVANNFYAKDVNGGLIALAELHWSSS